MVNIISNKVSVIVICYQQAQYLSGALQSVLDQTYTNWECIIVNDGSPDNTLEIAKQWCIRDNRFTCIDKLNNGPSSARNAGLNVATGAYIQFLDADDCLDKRKFELSVNELKAGDKNSIVFSNFQIYKGVSGAYTDPPFEFGPIHFTKENILYKWDFGFFIPIHCGFIEAGLFQDVRFPEHLKAKEDWVMWLLLFTKDVHIYFINLPLAFYHNHGQSMTKDRSHMEDNLIKTIFYIRQILPLEEYERYLAYFMKQKLQHIAKLEYRLWQFKRIRFAAKYYYDMYIGKRYFNKNKTS